MFSHRVLNAGFQMRSLSRDKHPRARAAERRGQDNLAQSQVLASLTMEGGCITREGESLIPTALEYSIPH